MVDLPEAEIPEKDKKVFDKVYKTVYMIVYILLRQVKFGFVIVRMGGAYCYYRRFF